MDTLIELLRAQRPEITDDEIDELVIDFMARTEQGRMLFMDLVEHHLRQFVEGEVDGKVAGLRDQTEKLQSDVEELKGQFLKIMPPKGSA